MAGFEIQFTRYHTLTFIINKFGSVLFFFIHLNCLMWFCCSANEEEEVLNVEFFVCNGATISLLLI